MRGPLSSFVMRKVGPANLGRDRFHRPTFSRGTVLYAKIAGSGRTRANVASCSKVRRSIPAPSYLFGHLPESVTETDARFVSSDFTLVFPGHAEAGGSRPGISGDDNLWQG